MGTIRTPDPVEPMTCLQVADLPRGSEWLYEVKLDGCRAVGWKDGSHTELFSGRHKSFDLRFPEIVRALGRLQCRSAIIDGEVVGVDPDGTPCFRIRPHDGAAGDARFLAFDVLEINGRDLRDKPLEKRRAALAEILPPGGVISLSPELPADPDALMNQARTEGFEGIIAKRRNSHYEEGEPSGAWQKWKTETV